MSMYDIYRGITKAKVFAGDTILFWKDSWNTDTLQDRYPRAFLFARNPDVSVRHLLSSERLGEVFHLPLSVEAKNEVIQIQSETLEMALNEDRDVWSCVWGGDKLSIFQIL